MPNKPDIWSNWLLHGRTGGDEAMRARVLENLRPVRDRVIRGARIEKDAVVLDVGCGDGMVGFAVLEQYPRARVIFSDISEALLEVCERIARSSGVADRCEFVLAAAEDLAPIPDESVDAVTLRSVLIYVSDKLAAHKSFHRVLRLGGHLSYFEPVSPLVPGSNRHDGFWGYETGPVSHLVEKIMATFAAHMGSSAPMLGFQDRDLVDFAEDAGFDRVDLRVDIAFGHEIPSEHRMTFDQWLKQTGNPKIPSVGEAIAEALTPDERAKFLDYMRIQVESGRGIYRNGHAYLTATKSPGAV